MRVLVRVRWRAGGHLRSQWTVSNTDAVQPLCAPRQRLVRLFPLRAHLPRALRARRRALRRAGRERRGMGRRRRAAGRRLGGGPRGRRVRLARSQSRAQRRRPARVLAAVALAPTHTQPQLRRSTHRHSRAITQMHAPWCSSAAARCTSRPIRGRACAPRRRWRPAYPEPPA